MDSVKLPFWLFEVGKGERTLLFCKSKKVAKSFKILRFRIEGGFVLLRVRFWEFGF